MQMFMCLYMNLLPSHAVINNGTYPYFKQEFFWECKKKTALIQKRNSLVARKVCNTAFVNLMTRFKVKCNTSVIPKYHLAAHIWQSLPYMGVSPTSKMPPGTDFFLMKYTLFMHSLV